MLALFSLPQASTFAAKSDLLYHFIYWFCVLSFIPTMGAMFYFMYRYSRKKSDPNTTPHIDGNTTFELSVSAGLFVIVMVIFAWGWKDYQYARSFPGNSLEVNITGKQWSWEMQYTNGRQLANELVVPVDTPITTILASKDVLHSFYITSFRVKQDVVPGRFTKLWFTATQVGEFPIYCAEFCGTAHSGMKGTVRVLSKHDFAVWQKTWELEKRLGVTASAAASAATESPTERGQKLFTSKGCVACHAASTQTGVGPGLGKIFGHEVEMIDGSKTTVDENYIRKSLMEPSAQVVKGFAPIMPTFQGQLSDDEVMSLVEYIKSLK